mmetsp:Transcript_27092/g.62678  ORF Transcript_27092/g.62678 Transcript_27092/m.62678 type:complete len:313 (+) Transcript_27092:83-1021(+)
MVVPPHLQSMLAADPSWISFSNGTARWVPFSVNASVRNAFSVLDMVGINGITDHDFAAKAMAAAESSIMQWIMHRIIERDQGSTLFRALGRGWIFVLINRKDDKFRWWFETLDNVLHKHAHELRCLRFDEQQIQKHTYGYRCDSEVVFLFKGHVRGTSTPTISIMQVREDFAQKDKWFPADKLAVKPNSPGAPLPSDADRRRHAVRVQQRRAYRQRVRQRRANGGVQDIEEEQNDARLARSSSDFERLLEEFKTEERLQAVAPARCPGDSESSGRASEADLSDGNEVELDALELERHNNSSALAETVEAVHV